MQTSRGHSVSRLVRPGPAIIVSALFVAGTLAGRYLPPETVTTAAVMAWVLLFLAAVIAWRGSAAEYILCITIVATGAFCGVAQRSVNHPLEVPSSLMGVRVWATGTLAADSRPGESFTRLVLAADTLTAGSRTTPVNGTISVNIYGSRLVLPKGSLIAVTGDIKKTTRPVVFEKNRFLSGGTVTEPRIDVLRGYPRPTVIYEPPAPAFRFVRHIAGRFGDYGYGGHAALMTALLFGVTPEDFREIRQTMADAGIAHLATASGFHAGLVALIAGLFLSMFGLHRRTRFVLIVAALTLYAAMCGFRAPIVRALILFVLVLAGRELGRRSQAENLLAGALLIMLAIDPSALFSASLQLSFAAAWAIMAFHPLITGAIGSYYRRRHTVTRFVIDIATVSLIAGIATAPVTATHFGTIARYGIPANIVAVPLAMTAMPLGLLSLPFILLGGPFTPVAVVISFAAGMVLQVFSWVSGFVAAIPGAVVELPSGLPLLFLVAFYPWLAVLSRTGAGATFRRAAVVIPIVYLFIAGWLPVAESFQARNPSGRLLVFDIGQGDAALVRFGAHSFLVDCGPSFEYWDAGRDVIAPALLKNGISHIDAVFISHLHDDHIGGLPGLMTRVEIGVVFTHEGAADSLSRLIGRPCIPLAAGDSLSFGGYGACILGPLHSPDGRTPPESGNEDSQVIRFSLGGKRVLFTGDIGSATQNALLGWGNSLRADILKAPHHGSGDTSERFVRAVDPETAVISCGIGNRYGHPSPHLLVMLQAAGIRTYRTDRYGPVLIGLPSAAAP